MIPPRISIVVPSFNHGRWLEATLLSLFRQGDPNLEVIVVDGDSRDESRTILERWRPRLAACIIEPDNGQADALLKGFARATGAILGWLNSDDMHLPWTLATVREAFTGDPSLECVHGDRIEMSADGTVTGYRRLPRHSTYLLNRWPWTHQETCLWKRELMERCGGIDASLRFAMDYDLFARFFRDGRCAHLPVFLGAFRWHSESKSFREQTTIGAREIALVRQRYGVTPRLYERPIGSGLALWLRAKKLRHRLRRHTLPTHPAARGFPIEALWDAAGMPLAGAT